MKKENLFGKQTQSGGEYKWVDAEEISNKDQINYWQQKYSKLELFKANEEKFSDFSHDIAKLFESFFPDAFFSKIAKQMNTYLQECCHSDIAPKMRNLEEMTDFSEFDVKQFIGLVLYMGLVKLPRISDYWSKCELFNIPFVKSIMPRNKFQILSRFLHFTENK